MRFGISQLRLQLTSSLKLILKKEEILILMKRINLKKQNSQDGRGDVASYDYLVDLTTAFLTGKH